MRRAEEMFDHVFDELFEGLRNGGTGTSARALRTCLRYAQRAPVDRSAVRDAAADGLIDNLMGEAKGPFGWLLKKGLQKVAKGVVAKASKVVETMEADGFFDGIQFEFNGQTMSGADFKAWRAARKAKRGSNEGKAGADTSRSRSEL